MVKYVTITCLQCGKTQLRLPHTKFCDSTCRKKYNAKPKRLVVCKYCKKVFATCRDNQVFCSNNDRCKRAWEHEQYVKKHDVQIYNRVCPVCDTPFTTNLKTKVYCTTRCRDKAQYARRKHHG